MAPQQMGVWPCAFKGVKITVKQGVREAYNCHRIGQLRPGRAGSRGDLCDNPRRPTGPVATKLVAPCGIDYNRNNFNSLSELFYVQLYEFEG